MIKKKSNNSHLKIKPQFNIERFLKKYDNDEGDYSDYDLWFEFSINTVRKNLIRNNNFEKLLWQSNAFNFNSIFPKDEKGKERKPDQPNDTVNKDSQQKVDNKFGKDFNPRYLIEQKARWGHVKPKEYEWFKNFLQPYIDNPSLLSRIPKKFVSSSIDLSNVMKRIAEKQQLTPREVNAIQYLFNNKDKESQISNPKSKLVIKKYANTNLNMRKFGNKKFHHKFNYQHKRILNVKK